MTRNPGHCPDQAIGKRVRVQLANGTICGIEPVSAAAPAGWAASGPGACRWTRTGSPFDIAEYEVIG